MHEFIYVGVRPDEQSRPIAFHEWCTKCGTLRSTRLADGDVVYLIAGTTSVTKGEDHCIAVIFVPSVRA